MCVCVPEERRVAGLWLPGAGRQAAGWLELAGALDQDLPGSAPLGVLQRDVAS